MPTCSGRWSHRDTRTFHRFEHPQRTTENSLNPRIWRSINSTAGSKCLTLCMQPVTSDTHTPIDLIIIGVIAAVAGFNTLGVIAYVAIGLALGVALTIRFFWAGTVCDGAQFRIGPFLYAVVFLTCYIFVAHLDEVLLIYGHLTEKLNNPDPPFALGLTTAAVIFFIVVGYQLDSGLQKQNQRLAAAAPPRVYAAPPAAPPQRQGGNSSHTKGAIKKKG